MERHFLYGLITLGCLSLACAGRSTDENKSMCDKPASTWKVLNKKTQTTLKKVCMIDGNVCKKADALACRSTWTYSTQFYVLEDWRLQHRKATTIDKLDAYITYFLKPTFRMHEEFWGEALRTKTDRQALGKATALMRTESKTPTDDYIVALRNEIRSKTNPKERELLIEAYSVMKMLNTKAFEPFEQYEVYQKDVREKLDQYEKIKIKLEFVDTPPKTNPKPPETKPDAPKTEPKTAPTPTTVDPKPQPATTPKEPETKDTEPSPQPETKREITPEPVTNKPVPSAGLGTKDDKKKDKSKKASENTSSKESLSKKKKDGLEDQWRLD